MKPTLPNLIPLCLMVLCGFCMAEEPAAETTAEVTAEIEVNQEPATAGKTSAAKGSAYFDEIFGNLGHWFAHAFSDDRPIESGNLSSSEIFMNGNLAAAVGNQNMSGGKPPRNAYSRPDQPPFVVDPPDDEDGPRIEIKSGRDRNSTGEGIFNDSYLPHSKAEIDRYFAANVLQKQEKPASASSRSEIRQSKKAVKAFHPLPDSNTAAASFAIQAVPEPSSILFCGFAAVMLTWCRRRPDSR